MLAISSISMNFLTVQDIKLILEMILPGKSDLPMIQAYPNDFRYQ